MLNLITFFSLIFTLIPGSFDKANSPLSLHKQAAQYLSDELVKGHFEGTITNVGENHKVFVGSGNVSIMGDVTVEIDYYITYETQYSGAMKEGGVNTIRASSGEELYIIAKEGTWYVNFIPNPPEVIFEAKGIFKGGTGRFKYAEGETIGTGTQLYIPGTPTVFDWTGTIRY